MDSPIKGFVKCGGCKHNMQRRSRFNVSYYCRYYYEAKSKECCPENIKEAELLELTCQVEEYIESIEKSDLRIMFRLYYLDGLPWIKVAAAMNRMFPKKKVPYTEDSCRMRNNRFFEKI